jgi:microcystin-dependent protein
MSDPYIGEIRMLGFSWAPNGWAMCNGQLLPISQNDALFVIIGTQFGGDGQETFALPDLRSRIPVAPGNGIGWGEFAGTEQETLTIQQIPVHNHALLGSSAIGTEANPTNNVLAQMTVADPYTTSSDPDTALNPNAVTPVGGSQPHENTQPFLVITFALSLFGLFPTQN